MYLRVANSTPAAPAALVSRRDMGALVRAPRPMPPALLLHLARRRGLRGLGGLGQPECAPYPISDQINMILSSWMAGLPYAIEQGTAQPPSVFASDLQQQVEQFCSGAAWGCPGPRCTVPTDQVASAIATYTNAYTSTLAQKAQQIAAGDICVPSLALFPGIVLSDRAKIGCGYGGAAAPAPAPASAPAPAPSSSGAPAAAPAGRPLGVTLQNASGGSNTQFRVGDTFRLVITGPANSQVTGSSQHDGRSGAAAPFGNTDSTGQAVISGTMTPDTVGGWVEQWFVGGQNAGSVSFSVAAPAAAPAPAPAGSSSSAGGGTAPPPAGGSTAPPPAAGSGFNFSSLSTTAATVGGIGVPWWALLAVGGVALYAMGSSGKR